MAFSGLPGYAEDLKLTSFIDDKVRPRTDEMRSLNEAIDTVVHYLHNFNKAVPGKDYRVKKTVKSGSLAKGTAVQNEMDIDIVVFLEKFTDMDTFCRELPEVLKHLENYLWHCPNLRVDSKDNRYMVKCTLFNGGKEHSLDILPAVDMVAIRGGIQAVHQEMAALSGRNKEEIRSHYSVCFAEYQKQFVKSKADSNSKIKDLIRLVKFWSKKNGLGKTAVSYSLELVCIQVHEEYSGNRRFDMKALFNEVMQKLINIENLRISFDNYYSSASWSRSWSAPYVMDPANPFQNTLPQDRTRRRRVSQAAATNMNLDLEEEASNCVLL